jgi:hypothetical protein
MSRASGEFFQAVDGLRHAVEREFRGNSYYLLANQVIELREILQHKDGVGSQLNGAHANFVSTLDAVRKCAEAELFDNRFYLVAHKLDVLTFLGRRFYANGAGAITASKSGVGANGASNGATVLMLEELAAAAKVRRLHLAGGAEAVTAAQPQMLANGEAEGEAPARVSGSSPVREPWKRWTPPAFLSKPFRQLSPSVYRRIWDHRPLKSMLMQSPAPAPLGRPKKRPPRERFVLPRQRMIARPLQPAKR